jgi:hypothetical protein
MTDALVKRTSMPSMSVRLARNPLVEWLRQRLSDPDNPGPCIRLTLMYDRANIEEEVQSTKFASGIQWKPEELADKYYNIAQDHVKDDKGIEHSFRLLAFFEESVADGSKMEHSKTKRFKLTPWGQDVEFINDEPTARGAQAQGMRLTEQIVQGTFKLLSQTMGSAAHETQVLREQNMKLFEMMQGLMVKIAQTEDEREMKRLTFERETKERSQWLSYAPALVNTLLNKEVFPQSTVDTQIIEAAAESLSEEDLQMLAMKLPQHLWGPMAARLEKTLKEKRLKKEEKTKLSLVVGSAAAELEEDTGTEK